MSGSSDSSQLEARTLNPEGRVGLDSLADQLVRKQRAAGFGFNLLCVGETGIGKTTLLESLFDMKLGFDTSPYGFKHVELRTKTLELEEGGVRVKLGIAETAGYGEQQDAQTSAKVIVGYIENQLELYLQEELKIKRQLHLYQDTRIHVCLYLLSPISHGLKPSDISTLQKLSTVVNVILVICKSDIGTKEELATFKTKILCELDAKGLNLYKFPENDATTKEINAALNSAMPFAVVGSTDFVERNGKKVRARQYPWGTVEVHCDFLKLREALVSQNLEDLRDKTHCTMYERYRQKRLTEMGVCDGVIGTGLTETLQEKLQKHKQEILCAEEEMKKQFFARVKEKELEIKKQEEALQAKFDSHKVQHDETMEKLDTEIRRVTEDLEVLEKKRDKIMEISCHPKKDKSNKTSKKVMHL